MPVLNKGDKWLCEGCHAWNKNEVTRCSFCSKPKPDTTPNETVDERHEKLAQTLHTAIDRMSFQQKAKAWRLLEDNVV
jgi:hypothetical protein